MLVGKRELVHDVVNVKHGLRVKSVEIEVGLIGFEGGETVFDPRGGRARSKEASQREDGYRAPRESIITTQLVYWSNEVVVGVGVQDGLSVALPDEFNDGGGGVLFCCVVWGGEWVVEGGNEVGVGFEESLGVALPDEGSDGGGGVQNLRVTLPELTRVGDDIQTTGGTVIWDSPNGEVPQGQLGGPASSLSAYPLALATDTEASAYPFASADIASDSVTEAEIDPAIAPTWTGEHTFNGGVTAGSDITPDAAGTRSVGTPTAHFNEMHATDFISHSPEPRDVKAARDSLTSYEDRGYGSMNVAEMVADLVTVVQQQQREIERLRQ